MKILFIPYGTEKAPATRYRALQYLPLLKNRGIACSVFSAISRFSTNLMIKSPDFGVFVKYLYYIYIYAERLFRSIYIMSVSKKFDIIFLQRTTFPLKIEILLKALNKNIIFDIDDAIYLSDKEGGDLIAYIKKCIKEREVISILKVSKAVIVENEYIKNFVSQYCKNIIKIPGPIDADRFFEIASSLTSEVSRARNDNLAPEVVIGWTGSPATTSYLSMLNYAFKIINEKYPFVKFHFIGMGNYRNSDIRIKKIEWSYDTEVKELQGFDVGIMPMPDNEWTRGKLGCKMLQYMSVGIPAVVSFTETNAEIIKNGENGFFARTQDEWVKILSTLIENSNLRKTIGRKGRETILEKCALSANINRLEELFRNVKA